MIKVISNNQLKKKLLTVISMFRKEINNRELLEADMNVDEERSISNNSRESTTYTLTIKLGR